MVDSAKQRMATMRRRRRNEGCKQITCWLDPSAAQLVKILSEDKNFNQNRFLGELLSGAVRQYVEDKHGIKINHIGDDEW